MTDINNKNKIFRYKFSKDIVEMLTYFGKLHQYNNRVDYKDAWKKWYELNNDVLEREKNRIINLGYIGNVEDKMYKAARYYFRKVESVENNIRPDLTDLTNTSNNKNLEVSTVKTRRPYILLTSTILEIMDNHIKNNIKNKNYKPSIGFDDFCKENTTILETENLFLKNNYNLDKNFISSKIKKTYKNRYYLITKCDINVI